MPQELMEWVTVLRDAGIGITALLILIYYMRSAGKNDQRGDSIVQQLIAVVANNNAILDKNNVRGEKHTEAVREQTDAVKRMEGKISELIPEMIGKQVLVTDALNGFEKTIDTLVKQVQLIDARVDTVKVAIQNPPSDMQSVAAELRGLSAEVHQSSETIIDMLKALTPPAPVLVPSSQEGFEAMRKAKETLPINQPKKPEDIEPDKKTGTDAA
jgi:type I site-specific restriction endonuclease